MAERTFFPQVEVRKEKGDLVTINVYQKLKDQIASEISRFYPEQTKKDSSDTAVAAPNEKEADAKDVQDKISVVVTKEVRENHLILTGRKQLIYNDNRHLVECRLWCIEKI